MSDAPDSHVASGSPPPDSANPELHNLGAKVEHRAAIRVNITWKAKVMMGASSVLDVKTADISTSGVGLVGHHPLPQHSVLQLAIQVPHPTLSGQFAVITGKIKVAFQVMRGGEYRTGAQFIDLPESYRELLRIWIERLIPKN